MQKIKKSKNTGANSCQFDFNLKIKNRVKILIKVTKLYFTTKNSLHTSLKEEIIKLGQISANTLGKESSKGVERKVSFNKLISKRRKTHSNRYHSLSHTFIVSVNCNQSCKKMLPHFLFLF